MTLPRKALIALTASTLLFGGQLRRFTDPANRFYTFWEPRDAIAMIVGMILVALAGLGFYEAVRRWAPRLSRLVLHVFLFGVAVAGLACTGREADWKTEVVLLGVAVFLTWSYGRPARRLGERLAGATLFMAPLIAISWGQMLTYATWNSPKETRPVAKVPAPEGNPIYLFIFDEWSFQRSTDHEGNLLPLFPNVRAFADQAFYFTEARSPGLHTRFSVPGLCFQTALQMKVGPDATWLIDPANKNGEKKATLTQPSIFSNAHDHGYETRVLGFYLPYRRIFGNAIDYSESSSIYKTDGLPFWPYVGRRILYNLKFYPDPISRKLEAARNLTLTARRSESEHWKQVHERLRASAREELAGGPDRSFTVIHFPCPHQPYIFDADGKYIGPYSGASASPHDPVAYERNLRYTDTLAGQFLGELKAHGRFDRAMIIITSDHSWRKDNLVGPSNSLDDDATRHVPLLIKFPGQTQAHRIEERFPTARIQPLLDAAMTGPKSEADCRDLIHKLTGPDR